MNRGELRNVKDLEKRKRVANFVSVLVHYNTMLTLENVSYWYPGLKLPTVSNLSLSFPKGSICGLLGANGTGKSTLLYLCAGLLEPAQGSACLDSVPTFERRPSTLSEIMLVPEEFELPAVSLRTYVRNNAPFYPRFSQEQFDSLLKNFRLSPDMHLGRLSMGQRKKALIAFALACNTAVILMDEPTNGLDIPGKAEFRRALVSSASEERTIIISTHQVRDLDRVLDRVVIIDNNEVLLNESIARLQEQFRFIFTPNPAETIGALWMQPTAGGYNIIRARVDNDEETDVNLESLFQFQLGLNN